MKIEAEKKTLTTRDSSEPCTKISNAITVSSENVTFDWRRWSAAFPPDFCLSLSLSTEDGSETADDD